ncbi:MAG: 4a-hydroxytetrahydrobiopterin dehydratase [Gemmatimonadetes bacterium]|nr:4a-hydroxytetrahydrobiopterin dehydratase [Gemmatimonadota bacterium]MCA9768398.1 4a-hydroxytetrahydrobiopterin dehydratase [Gemmatimonadota bacterium]MCB9505320.1 4a-hydroxytetrahydrobiopterin dehydratase [Gemmatimonadales bacterium]MCB9518028.1 4a-hydroxytetrahydrobiopterin dehydratase [Gemmatimonadales bacterium]HPF61000.1 4a-hydroxytetrahydrobiopterin dehydratase [Gemmatimonadales bacterium]
MTNHEPVHTGDPLLERLRALPRWRHENGWLRREYATDGWRTTMLVTNAIAFLAEAGNHHPDLGVHWGKVEVSLQTHSAGGITDKDLQLAAEIERLVTWQPTAGAPGLEGQPDGWVRD